MSFVDAVASFASSARKAVDKTRKDATVDLLSTVVKRTPVGKPENWKRKPPPGYKPGRLRGNWQTSIGSVNRKNNSPVDPTGQKALARLNSVVNQSAGDSVIYFANTVPYAGRIEFEGHSKQAPAGMARVTMAGAEAVVRKHARKGRL